MKTSRASARISVEASGFVLIGVVIMALALTILGLSLFSLSSYESQFLDRSLALSQAENTALGEIERAKYRLTSPPYRLESVQTQLPPGITAEAWQIQNGATVNRGPVSWGPDDSLTIDVTSPVADVARSASGRFIFVEAPNFYQRLVTTSGQLFVDTDAGARDRTVRLVDSDYGTRYSRVWQDNPDTSWTQKVERYSPPIKVGDAPVPDVRDFIEQPADDFLPRGDFSGDPIGVFTLTAPQGGVGYYRHVDRDIDGFSYVSPRYLTFKITGHVVVMFRYGLELDHVLNVVANGPDASLTIVAARNRNRPPPPPAPPRVGLWLEGGINSLAVPVFLVSDGDVYLEQNSADIQNEDTRVTSLCVFAPNAFLRGPYSSQPHHMWLSYDRSTNAVVDTLSDHSALPMTSPGGNHRLALVPGTWQMSAR